LREGDLRLGVRALPIRGRTHRDEDQPVFVGSDVPS
jgi:hypothetical protein